MDELSLASTWLESRFAIIEAVDAGPLALQQEARQLSKVIQITADSCSRHFDSSFDLGP